MARKPRIDVAGVPQHVIQRGVDRSVCFCDDLDREFYLASLGEACRASGCQVHAYVLMSNHVHLLTTREAVGAISAMMQLLGRRYVRRFNDRQSTGPGQPGPANYVHPNDPGTAPNPRQPPSRSVQSD